MATFIIKCGMKHAHLFPNFNHVAVKVWEWMSSSIPKFYWECAYLFVLRLELNHVSEKGTPVEKKIMTIKSHGVYLHITHPLCGEMLALSHAMN